MISKITILCHDIDFNTLGVLHYFYIKKKYNIDSIIIETSSKKKIQVEPITWKLLRQRYKPNLIKKIIAKIFCILNIEKYSNIYPETKYFNTISVKQAAKKLNIPCFTVKKHSSVETKKILEKRCIQYALLISSNYLIKPIIINTSTKIINAHCALLPQHRSLDAMPWSVLSKDKLGITTHYVDEGIDTGDILMFEEIKPAFNDDLISFRRKLNENIPYVLYKTIMKLDNKEITSQPQIHEEGQRHRVMTLDEFNKAEKMFQEFIKKLYK